MFLYQISWGVQANLQCAYMASYTVSLILPDEGHCLAGRFWNLQ